MLPERKSFFKKRALCALRALLKARTDSVQLWEAGRFREIIPALLRPFHALSASADVLSSTSRMPLNSLRPLLFSILILKMSQMEP